MMRRFIRRGRFCEFLWLSHKACFVNIGNAFFVGEETSSSLADCGEVEGDCEIDSFDLDSLFVESGHSLQTVGVCRESDGPGLRYHRVVDRFAGSVCLFLQLGKRASALRLRGGYAFERCIAGGWLLRATEGPAIAYWIPVAPVFRRCTPGGLILSEKDAEFSSLSSGPDGSCVGFEAPPEDCRLDIVVWRITDEELLRELSVLGETERAGYFLLGSHTRYDRPGDLYRHLIHGSVFEDRYAWPHHRRIPSENDAHALCLIFRGLQRVTKKRIYEIFRKQLLVSVLSRQSADGGFRHGEWSDGMESHFRLHCSAMHLMMDALEEGDDPVVSAALESAARFIADKRDEMALGTWFYHDELECSREGMDSAPFRWLPGKVLGKSPQNMLVLNTHLDALVALCRYGRLSGDDRFAAEVESGLAAAHGVLALRPKELVYRLLFSAIELSLMPRARAAALPFWKRAWKRIGWKLFVPWLPHIKTRYPRLVMPGGYVDRELSLEVWAHDYLAVNLMDLVRVEAAIGDERFRSYVEGILDCCRRTRIELYWLEQRGRAYAIGFLAEALCLLCRRVRRPELDAMLAETLTLCVHQGIGLPPSLLGGNRESGCAGLVPPSSRVAEIVVVDLTSSDRQDWLAVNTGSAPVTLAGAFGLGQDACDQRRGVLAAGAWMRALS